MKVTVIGIGQCGCNVCDEFYAIDEYARSFFGRRIEILVEAFALNTDETDLAGLKHVPKDKRHRMVIGASITYGHGVGKVNLDGARIMAESQSMVVDNVLGSAKFHESDAIFVIASGAGGTGSGGIGPLIKALKDRVQKAVYAIVVLPFEYEEKGETSFAEINSATCVKTVNQYADAVFLLDNERFARADLSLGANLDHINREMAKNFFDLFCAGEEKNTKYVGSKVLDAGDIKQTLRGICTIGTGEVTLSSFYPLKRDDYREAAKQDISAVGALEQALNNLCLKVEPSDASKILLLVTAPKDAITIGVISELSNSMLQRSPKAVIRLGDYPRRTNNISVTIILSDMTAAARLENLYIRAAALIKKREELSMEAKEKIRRMNETGSDIPPLIE